MHCGLTEYYKTANLFRAFLLNGYLFRDSFYRISSFEYEMNDPKHTVAIINLI